MTTPKVTIPAPLNGKDTGAPLSAHCRGLCEVASQNIGRGFTWSTTREGHTFWYQVSMRLKELATAYVPVSVRLTSNYTAEVSGDKTTVKVGCQTFPAAKVQELAALLK